MWKGGLLLAVKSSIQKCFEVFFKEFKDNEKSVRWPGRAFQIEFIDGAKIRLEWLAKSVLTMTT